MTKKMREVLDTGTRPVPQSFQDPERCARTLCGSCAQRPVEASGLCHACRVYEARRGHARSLAMTERQAARDQDARRLACALTVVAHRRLPPAATFGEWDGPDTLTLGEWAALMGYTRKRRAYR
jgi:hypothetical protein